MSITITEKQFAEAVSAAQDEWSRVMDDNGNADATRSAIDILHNLAFGSMIQKQLFKDEQEEN